MAHYQGFDLLGIEPLLTEEERRTRDTVREVLDREAVPLVTQSFRDASFPTELVPKLADLGIFGAHIDGYGCAGINSVAYGLVMQELERVDSAIRSFVSVQSSLAMSAIWLHGTEEQKQRFLPEMATGKKLGAFALTETAHGSDPSGMETHAERTGNGFRINGSKFWITNATLADVMVVWAKLDDTVRGFIVERGADGLTTDEVHNKLSMRMSATGSVVLEDVDVPEGGLLPGTKGLASALQCLTLARFGIAWGVIGAASACLHETLEYTKARVQFSRPLAGHQLVQQKLADMATEISLAQVAVYHLARQKDEGRLHHTQVSMVKYHNAQMALDVARTCRDLLGAAGILDEFVTMRHMVNLETVNTYEGTRHVHQLVLGRHLTGISAFE
jgi:glutaryl-CoA dehydrogenase